MIKKNLPLLLILSFLLLILFTCITRIHSANNKNEKQSNLVRIITGQAGKLLGKKTGSIVYVNDKKFCLDCIGTVSAIFYAAGLDIRKDFIKYTGNGVARFYKTLKDNNALHDKKIPEVGNVIFWDNTWDRNEDGKFGNDPLTHTGFVIKVDNDGTVHYVHANYVFGIVIEQMNLLYPDKHKDKDGKVINTGMYIMSCESRHPDHAWTSGQLFRSYGNVLKLKDYFKIK